MNSSCPSSITPLDPEALEPHFTAIGRFTVAWSHLEAGLETALHGMFFGLNIDIGETKFPRAFSKRVKAFKRAIRLQLLPGADQMKWIEHAEKVKSESAFRQWIIHGWPCQHDVAQGTILFAKYELQAANSAPETRVVSLTELCHATKRVRGLAGPTVELARLIQKIALAANPKYLAPDLPISDPRAKN